MSIGISALVWQADLAAMDKIVLLRLADFADAQGGSIYPAVGRICRDCGVSERHVQGVLRKYCASGLLVRTRDGGGRFRPSEYRFALEALKRCIPCGVSTDETPQVTTGNPAGGAPNPAPGAPNPSESVKEPTAAAAGDAVPRSLWITVGHRVLSLIGHDDPKWNLGRVARWLEDGADPSLDIYPAISRVCAVRRQADPQWRPRSLGYFDGAIADAVRERSRPLLLPPSSGNQDHGQIQAQQARTGRRKSVSDLLAERHPGRFGGGLAGGAGTDAAAVLPAVPG